MSTSRQRRKKSRAKQDDAYAVVIAAEREGIEVLLHGLSAHRAERIAAQKNRELDPTIRVHVVPEDQLT
ncbi:hypothetical protein [Haladaptatus sp. NG-SE-30]